MADLAGVAGEELLGLLVAEIVQVIHPLPIGIELAGGAESGRPRPLIS